MIISNEELAANLPTNNVFNFERLRPFQINAEREIKRVIGDDFFSEIQDYVDADKTPANSDIDSILELIAPAVLNLSFYMGFDILNTEISNTGYHRIETETSFSLYQRQEENLRRHFLTEGYQKIDLLLEYLEINKETYTKWADSDEYTQYTSMFVRTAAKFSQYININNSRYIFLRLKPAMQMVHDFEIQNLLGTDYYNELLTQLKEDTLTDENNIIIEMLEKAIPYLTIANANVGLLIQLTENGLFSETEKAIEKNYKEKSLPDFSIFNQYIEQNKNIGRGYMKSIENYLKDNIDSYKTFADSDAYSEDISVYDLNLGTNKIHTL